MLALYVIAQFFFNWGPNTTTFVVSGECFPTRYRSTAHGISAAMGKIGAILAQVISIPILSRDAPPNCSTSGSTAGGRCSPWLNRLMQIFALFMLCGLIVSLFCIPETKGITLEELSGEAPTSYNAGRNGSIGGRGGAARRRRNRTKSNDENNGKNGATASSSSSIAKGLQESLHWNPFAGGQPAGFLYPRMGARRYRRRRIFGRWMGGGNSGSRGGSAQMRHRDNLGDDYENDDDTRIDIMTSPELAAQREAARNNKGGNSNSKTPSRSHSGRNLLSRGGNSSRNRNRDSAASTATENTSTNNTFFYGGTASNSTKAASNSSHDSGEPGDRPNSRRGGRRNIFSNGGGSLPEDEAELSVSGLAHPPRAAGNRRPRGAAMRDDLSSDAGNSANLGYGGVGVFPGWGAGWGRIDRSNIGQATADNSLDDIRLHDVGQLLR